MGPNNLRRDKCQNARYRGDDELTRLRDSAVHGDVQSAWTLCQLYSGFRPDSFVHGLLVGTGHPPPLPY